ncbi:MAG: TerB family tellurite resistance protein [Bacteroidota bacterium]|nr:TerB family tellurite resistance protein [Bacteroidota bacterium]
MVKSQLSNLIQLAITDNDLGLKEQKWIFKIGENYGLSEEEINKLFSNPEVIPHEEPLTSDEKFQYLYNVVQLMKIDKKVFKSEIDYCETLAVKLGYKKSVIGMMSTMIFSDPNITADRELLKSKVDKYAKF